MCHLPMMKLVVIYCKRVMTKLKFKKIRGHAMKEVSPVSSISCFQGMSTNFSVHEYINVRVCMWQREREKDLSIFYYFIFTKITFPDPITFLNLWKYINIIQVGIECPLLVIIVLFVTCTHFLQLTIAFIYSDIDTVPVHVTEGWKNALTFFGAGDSA